MLLRRNRDSRITAQPRGGVRLSWSSQAAASSMRDG